MNPGKLSLRLFLSLTLLMAGNPFSQSFLHIHLTQPVLKLAWKQQDSFTFQLKALLAQISFIESQIKDTDIEINSIMEKLDSPVTTITGIGKVTGAAIISEIGDISKFDSPKKLAAYAGLDASVSQSGEFEAIHNVMSKRGSPYLRKAIFQAALVASFKDPVLSVFYQKKRAALRT